MNKLTHDMLIVAIVAVVTMLTRFIPFLLFPGNKKIPKPIAFLSRVLPCSVMGMLVIYCLKDISLFSPPHGIPEFLSVALVAGTYIWKRNTLLSILLSTACYMLLIQFVFVV